MYAFHKLIIEDFDIYFVLRYNSCPIYNNYKRYNVRSNTRVKEASKNENEKTLMLKDAKRARLEDDRRGIPLTENASHPFNFLAIKLALVDVCNVVVYHSLTRLIYINQFTTSDYLINEVVLYDFGFF